MNETTVGLVLAAGAGSRFGGGKLLAPLDGRPILQHVLDALAEAGVERGRRRPRRRRRRDRGAIDWRGRTARPQPGPRARAVELAPGRVRGGRRRRADAVLVALGDQPLVSAAAIEALLDAQADPARPDRRARPTTTSAVATRSCSGAPAFGARRRGGRRSRARTGARRAPGAGRARSPVDRAATPTSTPAPTSPTSSRPPWARARPGEPRAGRAHPRGPRRRRLLRARSARSSGPTRRATDDPVLAALLELVRSGRHVARRRRGRRSVRAAARPRARRRRAVRWSPSTRRRRCSRACARSPRTTPSRTSGPSRRAGRRPTGARRGVVRGRRRAHRPRRLRHRGDRAVPRRAGGGGRPDLRRGADGARAGVGRRPVLAAGPRRGAGRAAGAAGLRRAARGARPPAQGHDGRRVDARRFESRDVLEGFVRRQLWIDPAGPKEARFQAALDELTVQDGDGWAIKGRGQSDVGVVTWTPGPPVAR